MTQEQYTKQFIKLKKNKKGLYELPFPYTICSNNKEQKASIILLDISGYDAVRKMYKEFWKEVKKGATSVFMALDFPAYDKIPYDYVGLFSYDGLEITVTLLLYKPKNGKFIDLTSLEKVKQLTDDIYSLNPL